MDNMIIGQIVKAFGIRGEVKVKPLTDDMTRYRKLRAVTINNVAYRILQCRFDATCVYLALAGVDSRDAAERLVGATVEIDRVHAVEPAEGSYFIADLIGCAVELRDGRALGTLEDVASYGAADVFTVRGGDGKAVRFPFLKRLAATVDLSKRVIVLDGATFDEVCVYED